MNLYSEVFKMMKIDKEVAWSIVRILKGDSINFCRLIKSADSDDCPTNSRKFIKIVSALAGAKNSRFEHLDPENPLELYKIIELYEKLTGKKKQAKENSREFAHIRI